jgi:predicted short-subunit dehydrogenase-like oxidoreductase (DUF2520 family)
MDIVIIGSGNVATVMGRKMVSAGHHIAQVAGRSMSVYQLAMQLDASFTTDFSRLNKNADLYFIAIPDDALKTVHQWLETGDAVTVHTAGSVSSGVLKGISSRYGVVYPLQSLRSDVTEIPDIPLLVDGNTDETLAMITHFSRSLSTTVLAADDAYRKKIHLAAVITGNFSNHLYALAATWCEREGLDFNLLLPLIKETVDRLGKYDVDNLQTGPAMRKDEGTIEKHLHMLEDYPGLQKIYTFMSDSIKARYQ